MSRFLLPPEPGDSADKPLFPDNSDDPLNPTAE